MNINHLLSYTEELKQEIENLSFDPDDVRHSFYGLHFSTVYDYYIGGVSYKLSELIADEKVLFTKDVLPFSLHAERLREISVLDKLRIGYGYSLNRQLVLGSWSSFETCVSLIFNFLVTDLEYDNLIKKLNAKLYKVISKLDDGLKNVIIDIIKNSSFLPLNRKFNYIVNKNKSSYYRDLKEDKNTIDLIGTIRNCIIHSNGIYHGKNKEYTFKDSKFYFRRNEFFIQETKGNDIAFEFSIEIKEIFSCLILCINDIELIEYPEEIIPTTVNSL